MGKLDIKNWIYGLIFGGSTAIITLAFFISVLALRSVVNPSSTASVAYVFMIIYAFLAGILGFLAGLLIGWIVDLIFSTTSIVQSLKSLKITLWLAIVAGILVFTVVKYFDAKKERAEFNAKNTIGVKYDAGRIEKDQININELKNYDLDLNKNHIVGRMAVEYMENPNRFVWNGKGYIINFNANSHILIKNDDGSVFIDHSLDGYPYITGISFLVFDNNVNSYLFVLSRLRATSSLSILNVFSEEGKMIYEELMGRNNIIESGELNGEKVVIIGNKDSKRGEITISVRDFIYKIKM